MNLDIHFMRRQKRTGLGAQVEGFAFTEDETVFSMRKSRGLMASVFSVGSIVI